MDSLRRPYDSHAIIWTWNREQLETFEGVWKFVQSTVHNNQYHWYIFIFCTIIHLCLHSVIWYLNSDRFCSFQLDRYGKPLYRCLHSGLGFICACCLQRGGWIVNWNLYSSSSWCNSLCTPVICEFRSMNGTSTSSKSFQQLFFGWIHTVTLWRQSCHIYYQKCIHHGRIVRRWVPQWLSQKCLGSLAAACSAIPNLRQNKIRNTISKF